MVRVALPPANTHGVAPGEEQNNANGSGEDVSAYAAIHKSTTRFDGQPCASSLVCSLECLKKKHFPSLTRGHELHALGPARNHPAEGELDGLAAGNRRVEHRAVHQETLVVHLEEQQRRGRMVALRLDFTRHFLNLNREEPPRGQKTLKS